MNPLKIIRLLQSNSSTTYVRFVAEKGQTCCNKCLVYDGLVYDVNDSNKPKLPIHPNCRCHYETLKKGKIVDDIKAFAEVAHYTIVETQGPSALVVLDITKIAADISTNFDHWVWISKSMARVAYDDYYEPYLEINEYNTNKDAKGLATLISKMYKNFFKK